MAKGELPKGIKQVLSGNRARLEVNLKELFGSNVPNSSEFRQAVGQAIIDTIQQRTESNRSWLGSRFKDYTNKKGEPNDYAKSIEFRAYGKSPTNPNLKQTGDMLGLMDIISETPTKIVIGWDEPEEAAKAHGHVTGNVGVRRDFLGINNTEAMGIRRAFSNDLVNREDDVSGNVAIPSVPVARAFVTGGARPQRPTRGFGAALQRFLDGDSEG